MKNDKRNIEKEEEENKKKGFWITFFVHTILVCLALIPLAGNVQEPELADNTATFMDLNDILFEEPDIKFVENNSRKEESNEKSTTTVPEPAPQPEPIAIETVEDIEVPTIAVSENPKATAVVVTEAPKVTPTPAPVTGPTGAPADINNPGGNAANNVAVSGDGGNDNDLAEGVFGRKVMKRPNIKGLTKEKGKIAIKVCVSQEGSVIATKYLQNLSTIYDAKLVAAAVRAARLYKFDVDYTAPQSQWGKLTFVFDIA